MRLSEGIYVWPLYVAWASLQYGDWVPRVIFSRESQAEAFSNIALKVGQHFILPSYSVNQKQLIRLAHNQGVMTLVLMMGQVSKNLYTCFKPTTHASGHMCLPICHLSVSVSLLSPLLFLIF